MIGETDNPVSIYGHDEARDAVPETDRAVMHGLGVEGDTEDAVAWLEGEMDRLLGRSSDPRGRSIPIPPERRPGPRGYQAGAAYVDETQVRGGSPRVAEVVIIVRTTDGLERRIVVEDPEDVRMDSEYEQVEVTSFMDRYPTYLPGRFQELIMRLRYPRRVREQTRRWVPPEMIRRVD